MGEQGKKPSSPGKPESVAAGAGAPVSTNCCVKGCKKSFERFGFCAAHFEHFKFGLVKKDGQPAADYEKKLEQYEAHQSRKDVRKVA